MQADKSLYPLLPSLFFFCCKRTVNTRKTIDDDGNIFLGRFIFQFVYSWFFLFRCGRFCFALKGSVRKNYNKSHQAPLAAIIFHQIDITGWVLFLQILMWYKFGSCLLVLFTFCFPSLYSARLLRLGFLFLAVRKIFEPEIDSRARISCRAGGGVLCNNRTLTSVSPACSTPPRGHIGSSLNNYGEYKLFADLSLLQEYQQLYCV